MTGGLRNRLDGMTNPMLVKEMYQSLHSRKFLAATWLLLLASLFTYVLVFINSRAEDGCGDSMFFVFSLLTYLMAVCVLPYLAFSSLREDIEGRTIEFVNITRMSAARQIRGRLLASMAKLALLYSVVGPFAVAAFLFRNVGVIEVLVVLFMLVTLSLLACAAALFFGALTSVKHFASLARRGYLVVLVLSVLSAVSFMTTGRIAGAGFGIMADDLIVLLIVLTLITALPSWFLCAAASNFLTFEANRSSRMTKLVFLVGVLAAFGIYFGTSALSGDFDEEPLIAASGVASVALAACSLLWLTDRKRVPYRLREKLQKRGPMRSLPAFPFTDGPGASSVYFLLVCAVIAAGTALGHAACDGAGGYASTFSPLLFVFAYTLYLSAISRAVVRLFPEGRRTPNARRGVLLGLICANVAIALIRGSLMEWSLGPMRGLRAQFWSGLFPFVFMLTERVSDSWGHLPSLALPAVIGLVGHAGFVIRDMGRFLRGQYD